MKYKNPIIFADYSDPDVIRVDDTFYLTASSFNYVPGLPILVSKDCVNWELKNYALKNIQFEEYDYPQHSKGVWAPAIRFHDGRFYIYYGMPDEGIFMVSAIDPLGEWEEPVCVLEGRGLIDPCPLWDEDGNAFIVHGYAKSRIGFKSVLGIFEMSADGKRAVSKDHILFDGQLSQPTIEGPKVYKREGLYYIFAPAGGVRTGWQTVLRSRNIYGPYEEKIVLEQGATDVNGPHQGGLVSDCTGKDWFLHFQDMGFYGRICHLQPVRWENGWPVMGNDGEPVCEYEIPVVSGATETAEESNLYPEADGRFFPAKGQYFSRFEGVEPDLVWQWMGNWKPSFYEMSGNGLRLFSLNPAKDNPFVTVSRQAACTSPAPLRDKNIEHEPILWEESNVLTQKFIYRSFVAETELIFDRLGTNEQAGFCVTGGDYVYTAVRNDGNVINVIIAQSYEEDGIRKEKISPVAEVSQHSSVKLSCELINRINENISFNLYLEFPGCDKMKIATDFLPTDHTWTGAKLGIFAMALDDEEHSGYADFKSFSVTER